MSPPQYLNFLCSISLSALALLSATTARAEPRESWGTLLLSPDERQQLSAQRAPRPPKPPTPSLPADPNLVSRRLGPGTLWHEGIAYRLPAQPPRQKADLPQPQNAWPRTATLAPGAIRIRKSARP